MNLLDLAVVAYLFISIPLALRFFARKPVNRDTLGDMLEKYWYLYAFLILVFVIKTITFLFEPPVEAMFSIDFTPMVHEIEGDHIFWVQHYLRHPAVTVFASAIYIGSFLFIFVFSFTLFAFLDRKRVASELALLNLVLLFLTVPFYFFVVVYVPSYPKMFYPGANSMVKGMEPLLYNYGPRVNDFFKNYDTFNNCFPSMHIGYPFGILVLLLWNTRGYRAYKTFLGVMIFLIGFSIIYLGIHWLTDIVGGIIMGLMGAAITRGISVRFWRFAHRLNLRTRRRLRAWGLLPAPTINK